ncbi:hypothetical protein DPMN_024871 [Dreissena polymorpha]|uniref:Uncharacterized protein n=1 Tax=Dreissena polymorpha TaxID=45954 RepID=A0A9D4RCS1_DREPO|nr:hypothetical protein DPMN_024871 [Dreissena polymorpha]
MSLLTYLHEKGTALTVWGSRTDEKTNRLTWERYKLDSTAGQMSQLTYLHGKGTALTVWGQQHR